MFDLAVGAVITHARNNETDHQRQTMLCVKDVLWFPSLTKVK